MPFTCQTWAESQQSRIVAMLSLHNSEPRRCPTVRIGKILLAVVAIFLSMPAVAQSVSLEGCTLKNDVYTCDGAAFQKALDSATTVTIDTQNVDAVARAQLRDLLTKKLAKIVAPSGSPADLIFLIIPTGPDGINISPGEVDLGTLRVYSATPDGARGHLVWAETFAGQQDLPWPAVVRSLIVQFKSHFNIK